MEDGTLWIFLRHGESRANVGRWLSGHVDVELTARGQEQARAAGRLLADQPIQRAWSSDLVRAAETARIALAGRDLPLAFTPALRERRLGDWSRRDLDELRASGEVRELIAWEGTIPGGESCRDLAGRLLPWFAARATEGHDGPLLVVAHGGVIRVLLGLLDGAPTGSIGRDKVPNAQPISRRVTAATWAALAARWGLGGVQGANE